VERGFHNACLELKPVRRIVVYPGSEAYPLGSEVEVLPLPQLGKELSEASRMPEPRL
jgi:hypothetical protein